VAEHLDVPPALREIVARDLRPVSALPPPTRRIIAIVPIALILLVARAFPLRPRLAGALYGIGAGLIADAGWRLFCHFSDPVHVFGAHTLGIAVVVLIAIVGSGPRAHGSHIELELKQK
jgi:hypothetical protein